MLRLSCAEDGRRRTGEVVSTSPRVEDTENANLNKSNFPSPLDSPTMSSSSSSNSKQHSTNDSDDAGTEGEGDAILAYRLYKTRGESVSMIQHGV